MVQSFVQGGLIIFCEAVEKFPLWIVDCKGCLRPRLQEYVKTCIAVVQYKYVHVCMTPYILQNVFQMFIVYKYHSH